MSKGISATIASIMVYRRNILFIFLMCLALTLSFFLKDLKIDNALEVWFLKNDPILQQYNKFKKIYGNDEVIAAWVKPSGTIYDKEFISKIFHISRSLKSSPLIRRVISTTNAPYVSERNGKLIVEDMIEKDPAEGFDIAEYQKRLESNPLWGKILFNKDKTALIVLIEPVVTSEMDEKRPEIVKFVNDTFKSKGINYKLAGNGIVYQELNRLSLRDSSLFTGLSFVILIIAIVALFRKTSVLISSVITMIVSSLIFLGLFSLLGQKLNMISAILPALIVILCLEDVIFIFSNYYTMPPTERTLVNSIAYSIVPCFLTSFTTALGFFSFSTSPMAVLKGFGVFAAMGIMIEYIVAVIVSTFVLGMVEKKSSVRGSVIEVLPSQSRMADGFLNRLAVFVDKRRVAIVIACVMLLVLGVSGTIFIKIDTYSIGFLLDSNQIKKDSVFFEKDYGFYVPLEIRLIPTGGGDVKDPAFLKKLAALQDRLERGGLVQRPTSVTDVVKQLNNVLAKSYSIPEKRDSVAQELLLYELDEENDLTYFVDEDYRETRLTVRIPMVSSQSMKKIMDSLSVQIDETFGRDVKAVYGGYIPLYIKLLEYIADSQIRSFVLAFVLIFAVTGLYFRSLTLFLAIILPNILPIFMALGLMGYAGIDLDIATVTIAAITIGLSVDNSIHYLVKYDSLRKTGIALGEAVRISIVDMGFPMFVSNAILVLGYAIMVLASVKSVIYFGLLIGFTMFIALLCDLILLPALVLLIERE